MSTPVPAAKSNGGPRPNAPPCSSKVERRCIKADCNVAKLISKVPTRTKAQFVLDPKVLSKPMLINGFTTVFQLDGKPAKFSDIGPPNPAKKPAKNIYRVVPNTHAHITNYVVVERGSDAMQKINNKDPATMSRLLESQKQSAEQMLKKLLAGQYVANPSKGPSKGITKVPPAIPMKMLIPKQKKTTTPAVPVVPTRTNLNLSEPTGNSSRADLSCTSDPGVSAAKPAKAIPVRRKKCIGKVGVKKGSPRMAAPMAPPELIRQKKFLEDMDDVTGKKLPTEADKQQQQTVRRGAPRKLANLNTLPITLRSPTSGAPNVPPVPVITPVPLASLQDKPPVTVNMDRTMYDKLSSELAELKHKHALLTAENAKLLVKHKRRQTKMKDGDITTKGIAKRIRLA